MGDRVGDFLEFTIMMILLTAFIVFGMYTFRTTNAFNRYTQEQLSKEIVEMENAKYNAYNGKIISGREAKNLMIEYGGRDCAFLVSTLALNKASKNSIPLYGTLVDDFQTKKVPGTYLQGMSMNINKNIAVSDSELYAINFGSILTACTKANPGSNDYVSALNYNGAKFDQTSSNKIDAYGRSANTGYQQAIKYDTDKGVFMTTGTYAFNPKDINQQLRYDKLHDLDIAGSTMYIPDMAQFYSYLIKDGSNDIIGFVFIQVSATDEI